MESAAGVCFTFALTSGFFSEYSTLLMAAPAYWLTFEDRPGYLLANVQGLTDSLEVSISFWHDILAEAHQRGVVGLLVEEDFANNITEHEMRQVVQFIGESLEQLGLKHLKIAFYDARVDQLDPNRVGETTAEEFGVRCRVFDDFRKAENWLLEIA
jgi:hypothetical protein